MKKCELLQMIYKSGVVQRAATDNDIRQDIFLSLAKMNTTKLEQFATDTAALGQYATKVRRNMEAQKIRMKQKAVRYEKAQKGGCDSGCS